MGSGRTSLYTPASDGTFSVYTADNAPERDLTDAGLYVARDKRKEFLFGWSFMTRAAYAKFDLLVTSCEDGLIFGVCEHMQVSGWPKSKSDILSVAQKLSKKEESRHILPERLPTNPDS